MLGGRTCCRGRPDASCTPAESRKGMAPRRSADGCIRRPQLSRWTRQVGGTHCEASQGRNSRGAETLAVGLASRAESISDSPNS